MCCTRRGGLGMPHMVSTFLRLLLSGSDRDNNAQRPISYAKVHELILSGRAVFDAAMRLSWRTTSRRDPIFSRRQRIWTCSWSFARGFQCARFPELACPAGWRTFNTNPGWRKDLRDHISRGFEGVGYGGFGAGERKIALAKSNRAGTRRRNSSHRQSGDGDG